jgi:hypothetical protein
MLSTTYEVLGTSYKVASTLSEVRVVVDVRSTA